MTGDERQNIINAALIYAETKVSYGKTPKSLNHEGHQAAVAVAYKHLVRAIDAVGNPEALDDFIPAADYPKPKIIWDEETVTSEAKPDNAKSGKKTKEKVENNA